MDDFERAYQLTQEFHGLVNKFGDPAAKQRMDEIIQEVGELCHKHGVTPKGFIPKTMPTDHDPCG